MSGSKRPLRLRFPPLDRGLPDGPEQGCWKTRSKSQLRTTQGVLKEGNQVPHSNSSASEVSLASARPPRRGGGREGAGSFRGRGGGRAEAFLHRAGRSRSPCPLSGRPPWPPRSSLRLWTAQRHAPAPMRRAKSAPKMGWEENVPTLVPSTLAAHHVLHLFPPPGLSAPRAPRSAAGRNCPEGLALRRESPRGSGHSLARGSPPVPCGGTAATASQSSRSGRAATSRVTRGCPPLTH